MPIPGASETLEASLVEAVALIEAHETFLVTCHRGPDGDAIGSVLAFCHLLWNLGKEATPYSTDQLPYTLEFLPGSDRIVSGQQPGPQHDVVAVLDCGSFERVSPDFRVDRSVSRVLCVDHHLTIDSSFADVMVHDAEASSTGELIYRLAVVLGAPLTPEIAKCLYAAIHTDTGGFRYSTTSAASLAAASELVRAGVNVWEIASEIYENYPEGRIRLLGQVLETLERSSCGRLAFITVSTEMYEQTDTGPEMLDGFINYARGISGVEVAAQIRQTDPGKYRVSFRSRGRVNVAELAEGFGGGGHHNAAACRLDGEPREIIERLTEELNRILD
jgi:phosphoesterase RecJ-like protein